MLRVIAFHVLVLALPFIAYAVYVYLSRREVPEGGIFAGAPIVWLAATGLAMTIVAFFIVAALTGADPGAVYRPAELRDGEIVPGRTVVPETEPGR